MLIHFVQVAIDIFMYLVSYLCFFTLEKWPSVGDTLCTLAVLSFLVTRVYALGIPPRRAVWVLQLWWAYYVSDLIGLVGPSVQFISVQSLNRV